MSTKTATFVFRLFRALMLLILLVSTVGVTPAHAAGIHFVRPDGLTSGGCDTWANACTLQTALTGAISGDEIWVAAGVYKPVILNAPLDLAYPNPTPEQSETFILKPNVALYGGFNGTENMRDQRDPLLNVSILSGDIDNNDSQTPIITNLTTVTGNTTNSYHVVTGATSATLDGFTITAGNSADYGGGMYNLSSSPTLTNVTFSGNSAFFGGGLANYTSSPTLTNVTFTNNSATAYGCGSCGGGGMFNMGSSPRLTNVTFSGNSATRGGGILNFNGNSPEYDSNPILTNVIFSGNSASSQGGGMENSGGDPVLTDITFSDNLSLYGGGMFNSVNDSPSLTNVTFNGNSASISGGGMYNNGSPSLTNVTFIGNSAKDSNNWNANTYGGGMYNYFSNPMLTGVTFSSNVAKYGGGMYARNSNLTLTNITFDDNVAWLGGGIYNSYSGPMLTDLTFTKNSADYGGGMYNRNSNPILMDVTFDGNEAGYGGGMYNQSSNPILTNITFSRNSADYGDGGGMNNESSSPTLNNVTFSGNSTGNSGGGMYNYSSNPNIHNTIFWGNTDTLGGAQIYNYDVTSFPVVSDSIVQDGYPGGTNIFIADPLLGTLSNYGGFTQTIPLLPGSSAINAGNATYCPINDQRSRTRFGVCDIGAFESQGFTLASLTGSPQNAMVNSAFATPLGLTVTANGLGEPVDGGIVTFVPPASGASAIITGSPATITGGMASTNASANGTSGIYQVTAGTNGAVTDISFNLENTQYEYILTVTSEHGTVTKHPDQATYHNGETVTLSVIADPGWSFTGWSPALIDNKVTISGDMAIIANYSQNEYTLVINTVGNGTISTTPDQPNYLFGSMVELTATASPGWTFSGWSGDTSSTTNPLTVTMDGNKAITATFIQNEYTLTVNTVGSGSVTRDNNGPYHQNDIVTLTAVPDIGWTFTGWTPSLTDDKVVINGDITLVATFTQNTYMLNMTVVGSGTVSRDNNGPYHFNDIVKFTAMPASGWSFSGWSENLTGITNPATITMDGNKAVTATFVSVDMTPPNTTIITFPPNPSYGNSATFTFTGTDNITLSNSLTFECKLDSGAWVVCTSPNTYSSLTISSHTFLVRAMDEGGNVDATPASYSWKVKPNQPPVADAGGPYNGNEGSSITLNASPSSDPDKNIASYEWDLDDDGQFDDATGMKPKFFTIDNGVFTVHVRVTDTGGLNSIDSAMVIVRNLPPVVTSLSLNSSVRVGAIVNALATFKDAGIIDTFTATWKWGDGTTSTGTISGYNVSGSHTYLKPGFYLVRITIKDNNGAVTQTFKMILVLPKR